MIKQMLVAGVFIFIVFALLVYLLQRHLIYFPAKEMPDRRLFGAEDMQQINLHTADDLILNSWYKPAAPNRPTLLYLHGNAGHIGYRMPLVRQFLSAGIGVLLLEYRGYGGNKGQPTEQGLYQDGRAAMRFLQQQGIAANHLILYGESIGTGVATQLAIEFPVCALVLQSPYTSMFALARHHYPWLFIPPWDKFDSLARIHTINRPLLVLHGMQDQIVPYAQARLLFENANEPKQFIDLIDKGHNDLWDAKFVIEVERFIQTYCS